MRLLLCVCVCVRACGRAVVCAVWFTAETGGVMISPQPAPEGTPSKPGFPQIPFLGVDLALLDDKVPTVPVPLSSH